MSTIIFNNFFKNQKLTEIKKKKKSDPTLEFGKIDIVNHFQNNLSGLIGTEALELDEERMGCKKWRQ